MSSELPSNPTSSDRQQRIINYYDLTQGDYERVWDLGNSLAMHAGHWDETTKTLPQALARQNEVLAKMAGIKGSDMVLDAGCGVGGSLIYLAKKFGCFGTGITLSERQAETAHRNALRRGAYTTEFLVGDYENMDAQIDRGFHVVWAIESVCHSNRKDRFAKEAHRVLKNRGRLILADAFAAKKQYSKEEQAIMRSGLGWGVDSLATTEEFGNILADAGFTNISFTDTTENVAPSSKRLYDYARWGLPLGRLAERLGLRTPIQTANIITARDQHLALTEGLSNYGIFYAEKPAAA